MSVRVLDLLGQMISQIRLYFFQSGLKLLQVNPSDSKWAQLNQSEPMFTQVNQREFNWPKFKQVNPRENGKMDPEFHNTEDKSSSSRWKNV